MHKYDRRVVKRGTPNGGKGNTMADETTTTTTETAPATTPAATLSNTQSTAATVDEAAIIARAEAKAAEVAQSRMEGAFKSMLAQSGLDADAITKITDEWKSKQTTPEQIAQEKDDEIARLKSEIEQTRNERIAIGKGVPDDRVAAYTRLAAGYDGDDFAAKLDAALAEFPLASKTTPPPYAAGTGKTSMRAVTREDYDKMTYLDRVKLKEENPQLFTELTTK